MVVVSWQHSRAAISGQVEPGESGLLVQDEEWTGWDAGGVQVNLIVRYLGQIEQLFLSRHTCAAPSLSRTHESCLPLERTAGCTIEKSKFYLQI